MWLLHGYRARCLRQSRSVGAFDAPNFGPGQGAFCAPVRPHHCFATPAPSRARRSLTSYCPPSVFIKLNILESWCHRSEKRGHWLTGSDWGSSTQKPGRRTHILERSAATHREACTFVTSGNLRDCSRESLVISQGQPHSSYGRQ